MTNQVSWRMPIAIQSIFSILSGTSIFCLPDTPRWYYVRDRIEEGDKTLARLYGVYRKGMTEYHDVPEIKAMKSTIISNFRAEEVPENKLTLFSIIWDNTPLRVFAEVGLSDFMASLIAAISPTVQWMGSWVCIPTIERIGRRKIMIFTASIETCCMLVFIVLNMIENETDTTQWASAMIMFPYLFFYGWGWVGCPWIYGPEVFNIIAFIFVYFMCLDPTGKTLEEIDQLFAKDDAILERLHPSVTEKADVQEVESNS